jgi:cytochrome oxidase assembly protein ShyY1
MASDYVKSSVSRWLRWFALAVVFAIACAFLANWQLNRREQVVKIIERIDRNYSHQRVRL